ncbi:MAG: hypothetical protein LBO71_04675 [Prevotellaceae bacterium]|nr:hypothetical protein [Prevotellaceae bacterium]
MKKVFLQRKDLRKGALMAALLDVALMLPAVFVFLFPDDWLRPVFRPSASVAHGFAYYTAMGVAFMLVMYAAAIVQHKSTFIRICDESATRRILLA